MLNYKLSFDHRLQDNESDEGRNEDFIMHIENKFYQHSPIKNMVRWWEGLVRCIYNKWYSGWICIYIIRTEYYHVI